MPIMMSSSGRKCSTVNHHLILCILISISLICPIIGQHGPTLNELIDSPTTTADGAARSLYSARLDYNNVWTPIGHGDPLKKDPTYDYSPPVLDRVRYWAESGNDADAEASDDNGPEYGGGGHKTKSDILLLGVSSKRPQFKSVDSTAMRRNYFPHQLPTVLMPPPMQPLTTHALTHEDYPYYAQPYHTMRWSSDHQPHSHSHSSDANAQESMAFSQFIQPNGNPYKYTNTHGNSISPFGADHPQPTVQRKKPWIQALLQKEVTPAHTTIVSMQPSPTFFEAHTIDLSGISSSSPSIRPTMSPTTTSTTVQQLHHRVRPHPNGLDTWETTTHFMPTIQPDSPPQQHQNQQTMTTDSLFAHYNQPEKPLPGPMYLIIEGHSKVKTYGGHGTTDDAALHAPKFVPVQSTVDPVVQRVVSQHDDGRRFEVKHLHYKQPSLDEQEAASSAATTTEQTTAEKTNPLPTTSGMSSLLSLLDTSFGDFFAAKETTKTIANNAVESTTVAAAESTESQVTDTIPSDADETLIPTEEASTEPENK